MIQDTGPLMEFMLNAAYFPLALQTPFTILCIVLPLTALCALAGLPFMAVAAQALGQIRQRSFYSKAARQLATLALVQGWVCTFAGGLLLWSQLASAELYPALMQGYMIWWGLLATCTLCVSLYVVLWKNLRNWETFHQCLEIFGGSLGAIALYAIITLVDAERSLWLGEKIGTNVWELFMPQQLAPVWDILYFMPPLAISLSAGLGALWMLTRRKNEDYGRDHYNAMLPWCACWARNAWALVWLILLSRVLLHVLSVGSTAAEVITVEETVFQVLYLLLWLVPAVLWAIVARSKIPLRHTLTLVLAQCIAMAFAFPLSGSLP